MKIENILKEAMKNEITKEAADIVECHINVCDRNYRDTAKVKVYVHLHGLLSDLVLPYEEKYDRFDLYEKIIDETLFQVLGKRGLYKVSKSELYRTLVEKVIGEPAEGLLDERKLVEQEKDGLFNEYQISTETRNLAVKLGCELEKNLRIFVNGKQ